MKPRFRTLLMLAAGAALTLSVSTLPSSAMSFAGIVINEVLANPGDPDIGDTPFDSNNDGVNDNSFLHLSGDEFVEIWNSSGSAVDLQGLELWDASNPTFRYRFDSSFVLGAGDYFVIFGNSANLGAFTASAAAIVNGDTSGCELCATNTGDVFQLRDGMTVVDSFETPLAFPGESFVRNMNGDIVRHTDLSLAAASPGMATVPTPEPGTALMIGLGLVGCGAAARRRR